MIKISILDYLGKYEDGILVSVGLMCDDKFYNSIFFYTKDQMAINVEAKMTEDIGSIEEHSGYLDMLKDILENIEPFDDIYDKLEEVKDE